MRTLSGIDEIRDQLTWVAPPDNLDIEFEQPDTTDHGDGTFTCDVRELYRMKQTGELAYTRKRLVKFTIQDGKVIRYEMSAAQ
jgi:hypothetical protein